MRRKGIGKLRCLPKVIKLGSPGPRWAKEVPRRKNPQFSLSLGPSYVTLPKKNSRPHQNKDQKSLLVKKAKQRLVHSQTGVRHA
jgi:hypothetical protein